MGYCDNKVEISRDEETGHFVTVVSSLVIADYGETVEEALQKYQGHGCLPPGMPP